MYISFCKYLLHNAVEKGAGLLPILEVPISDIHLETRNTDLILWEGHDLRFFENRVLGKVFGTERDVVAGK